MPKPIVNLNLNSNLPTQPPGDWRCGIFAATRLLQAYGHNVSLDEMTERIGPLTFSFSFAGKNYRYPLPVGNTTSNIVYEMKKTNPSARHEKFVTFEFIRQLLAEGKPVATLIQVGVSKLADSSIDIPLLHWIVVAGLDEESKQLKIYNTDTTTYSFMHYNEFLRAWSWDNWRPFTNGQYVEPKQAFLFLLYGSLDNILGRNSIFWLNEVSPHINKQFSDTDILHRPIEKYLSEAEFQVSGDGVTNCTMQRAYQDGEERARKHFGTSNFFIDVKKLQDTYNDHFEKPWPFGARSCEFWATILTRKLEPTFYEALLFVLAEARLWAVNKEGNRFMIPNRKADGRIWTEEPTLCCSHDERLYVIENGCLWRVNPTSGDIVMLKGGREDGLHWRKEPKAIVSLGNSLYIIENERLWHVNPNDGVPTLRKGNTEEGRNWRVGTILMTAFEDKLYIVENDKLWKVDPNTGNFSLLPGGRADGRHWQKPSAICALGSFIYVIENDRLWKVDPNTGKPTLLPGNREDGRYWQIAPIKMCAEGSYLYVIENRCTWQVDPNTGLPTLLKGETTDGIMWDNSVSALVPKPKPIALHAKSIATTSTFFQKYSPCCNKNQALPSLERNVSLIRKISPKL